MTILLERSGETKGYTLGELTVIDEEGNRVLGLSTLELGWKNNVKQISCIPTGKYKVNLRTSKKFGKHLELKGVEGREMILIHAGNTTADTQGCILVGMKHGWLGVDRAVLASKTGLGLLLQYIKKQTTITII